MIRELLPGYGAALLAWAAVIYTLPVLWRPLERAGLRAHWFALLALALALTFLLRPVYLAVDAATGLPNLARLVGHACVLISACCVQVYFAYLALPDGQASRTASRGGLVLTAAVLLLGVLFRLANVREEDPGDFTGHFASLPFVLEFRLVFFAYLGWTMLVLITLARRYAPVARNRPALYVGLHLLGLGGWLALAYVVHDAAWATSSRLGLPYPIPWPELIKDVLKTLSIGLVLVGATLPSWGPRVGFPALYQWARRYSACRRLYPLWRELCRVFPEVPLVPPSSQLVDILTVRGLELLLTRRVVEIRDCRLTLRTYLPAGITDAARLRCQAAGLSGTEEQATIEAACLSAALRAHQLDLRPQPPSPMPEAPYAADLEGEAAYLTRVAEAYRRSPIIRAARESVRPPSSHPAHSEEALV